MNSAVVDLGWDLPTVAADLGGVLHGEALTSVASVSIDSREDLKGALFVAISGDRFDGHDFVGSAMGAGAVAAVVEPDKGVHCMPRIEVPDTGDALLALGAKRRRELTMPVVAVTGSTGKTSTKDLIAAGIEGSWASPRSFNNEVGVPLTVLATPDDASALILEVGSRGPGHIEWLASAIAPDVAVVTNLGVVHLETFGSSAGLADAKYELVQMLGESGTAVVPSDEPRLRRGGVSSEITFGESNADITIRDLSLNTVGRPSFDLEIGPKSWRLDLGLAGAHQAVNAAAGLAVAHALGLDLDSFIAGMQEAAGSPWRMEIHQGAFTVVNDAYNANPQSVASALDTVAAMTGGRRIAVLGPMSELGAVCEMEHRRIGKQARSVGFDELLVVGIDHGYGLGFGSDIRNATDLVEAADTLRAVVEPGDIVLVKASRSAGLERLATDLIEEASA